MKSVTALILLLSTQSIHCFAPPRSQFSLPSVLNDVTPHVSDFISTLLSSDALDVSSDAVSTLADPAAVSEASDSFSPTYSKASYYTTLALYVASFPGLWSQIKRSTTAKVKRKTYVSPGENAPEGGKELRQQAGEIMAYMKANNYEVAEAGETITFRGLVARSTSQAFFLTFCTALGMASLALVLQIQFQDLELPGIGKPNYFLLTLLSPYAGLYYWRSGDRVDDMKVKLAANDDETLNEITIEGNDEEIDRMWRTLDLQEKGMVKVEGILG
ncbi:hypothetical protein ACHAXN_004410 [Cyclotella atomus]